MKRFKITIEYFGKGLVGWQAQEKGVSVQGILQEAIYKLSQETPQIVAAGRTDAGVHAYGQVAHFDLEKDLTVFNVQQGLNSYLCDSQVSVVLAEEVDENFSARFSAEKRYYKYIILNRRTPSALERDRAWHVPKILDVELMREGSQYLIGKHDFTSFRASECQAKNPIRSIDELKITKVGDFINIEVSAKSFLHHQIRNITGTLKQVGEGKIKPEQIKDILLAKDRAAAGETAPAYGLYFMKVDY